MYAILYNSAEMQISEIHDECEHERWVPLLVYRFVDKLDDLPRLVIFDDKNIATRFIERNITTEMMQAGWVRGLVSLTKKDIDLIEKRGWLIDIFKWPRRIIDNNDLSIGFVIHNFAGGVKVRNI